MPIIPISSVDDPRLDDYRNVPDHELLASRGIFIAEGRFVVRRLLDSRFATRSLLVTDAVREALDDRRDRLERLPVYVAAQETMNAIVGFNIHRGCLAVGERGVARSWREVTAAARTVVVLEKVGNADNVGGVFRNAAAFGAGAVLLGPSCADPLYRKAIRTSMGASLQVPFASMANWPAGLLDLRDAGFTIVGLTPSGESTLGSHNDRLGRARADRVAIFLGHEGSGLSDEVLRVADVRARIAMAGGVDSVNVATAAAIALFALSNGRQL